MQTKIIQDTPRNSIGLARPKLAVPVTLSGGSPGSCLQPVTFGVPVPRSQVWPERIYAALVAPDGESTTAQVNATRLWPDGSARWLLVDAVVDSRESRLESQEREEWRLELTEQHSDCDSGLERLTVEESSQAVVVDTGNCRFEVEMRSGRPFVQVLADGQRLLDEAPSLVVFTDRKGRRIVPRMKSVRVTAGGPIRATVELQGTLPTIKHLTIRQRLHFFAGTGLVRADVTLHNSDRARHKGGIWDLGDRSSVLFQDFSLELSPLEEGNSRVFYRLDPDEPVRKAEADQLEIVQESSGGENWNSENHVNRHGKVPLRFRGCRIRDGSRDEIHLRPRPIVEFRGKNSTISAAIPEFWQQYPKAIVVGSVVEGRESRARLRLSLFPGECADLHELQGGERKTHTVWLDFGSETSQTNGRAREKCHRLGWVDSPILVGPADIALERAESLPALGTITREVSQRFESYLSELFDGENSLFNNRERADEYGWRNYGEIYADHEEQYYTGDKPLVSHYNNQFDMVQGFLLQYLRTGDRRWFELGNALARHVVDIDIYHTTRDRAAYNNGMFWFTDHYLHAGTSTHRTYTRSNRRPGAPYGGGPNAQHNFTSGLLLHYLLTGNRDSRDAVVQVADWVMHMEDGRRTVLAVADDAETGLATGSSDGRGTISRAGGNSINALLDGWLLTRDHKYVEFAERLIRRCVHPDDDVASRELLDVERNWSYTVFLSALAKYLDVKAAEDEFDRMYAYSRDCLVLYARWMLEHERPYFDQVEKLEYPTEAWAAQEFRKANVMRLAAQYAEDPLRSQLLDRGDEFADRAWSDLERFETRTSARAAAILLTEGLVDCRLRERVFNPLQRHTHDDPLEAPQPFYPQNKRVFDALRSPSCALSLTMRLANPWRWIRTLRFQSTARSAFNTPAK